jgi:hypothetical protein
MIRYLADLYWEDLSATPNQGETKDIAGGRRNPVRFAAHV